MSTVGELKKDDNHCYPKTKYLNFWLKLIMKDMQELICPKISLNGCHLLFWGVSERKNTCLKSEIMLKKTGKCFEEGFYPQNNRIGLVKTYRCCKATSFCCTLFQAVTYMASLGCLYPKPGAFRVSFVFKKTDGSGPVFRYFMFTIMSTIFINLMGLAKQNWKCWCHWISIIKEYWIFQIQCKM